jgi:DNA-directed RNA polymerase sigma subunit (sigma70/sigma32)
LTILKSSKNITSKEKEILTKRLLHKNLFSIGKNLKISGERVRQIEKHALEKLSKKLDQLSLFD